MIFLVKQIVISCSDNFPSLGYCIQQKDRSLNNMITIFFPITIVTTWVDTQHVFQVDCHTHPSIIISNVVQLFHVERTFIDIIKFIWRLYRLGFELDSSNFKIPQLWL